jgi:hypothetical protein
MLPRHRDPNFLNASADRIHGLPVVRLALMLDLVELMSRLAPGCCRKRTQIVKCAASEFNGLRYDHYGPLYKILYKLANFFSWSRAGQGE